MTELMNELYYMVDEWASQQDKDSGKAKDLQARLSDIEDEIELRLGEGGREMLEILNNLSLELEELHDQALFRAAMNLGTQIAQPFSLPPTGGKVPQCAHWGG